jgi:hypothetical protein
MEFVSTAVAVLMARIRAELSVCDWESAPVKSGRTRLLRQLKRLLCTFMKRIMSVKVLYSCIRN